MMLREDDESDRVIAAKKEKIKSLKKELESNSFLNRNLHTFEAREQTYDADLKSESEAVKMASRELELVKQREEDSKDSQEGFFKTHKSEWGEPGAPVLVEQWCEEGMSPIGKDRAERSGPLDDVEQRRAQWAT